MQIYVINLERASDRRQKMEQQARDFSLDFSFIEAKDGKFVTDAERASIDQKRRKRVSKYPLSDNEIGCWISHKKAMQKIIESGEKMAVILEDDAKLLPHFSDMLKMIETSGFSFDFIDLHRLFKRGEVFAPCRPLFGSFVLGRVGPMHMHATSYIMSNAGAKKFMAYSKKFAHVIDKEMHRYWANGLDIYGLNQPVVVADDGGFSYIDETRKQDKPTERIPLPNANTSYWWMQRKWEQLKDSFIKRLAFPAYVKKGKRNLAGRL